MEVVADRLQPALERLGIARRSLPPAQALEPPGQLGGRCVTLANLGEQWFARSLRESRGQFGSRTESIRGDASQRLGRHLPPLHSQRHRPRPDMAELQPGVCIAQPPQPAGGAGPTVPVCQISIDRKCERFGFG